MSPEPPDDALLAALEDYHRRRALGESVDVDAYRARLTPEAFERLLVLVARDAARADNPVAPATPVDASLPRRFGIYLLERVVGGGGMGIVYAAFDCKLARRVAVKVLPRALEADEETVRRFRGEARKCAQVRHPNVVTVYEDGVEEGQYYYAMELIEGQSLQAHIDAGTVPPVRELFRAVADVADGLEAIHRAGVVHRDVKPANIMVRASDGRMILADFGLARTFTAGDVTTQLGTAIGTPPYMSPEQLLGRVAEVDARSDVYGLGATLYHAVAGHLPFAAREASDLMRMVVAQRPEPLRRARPDVELEAEAVVLKALEKRKEDRYTTAGDMRDDLRRVAVGHKPAGQPVPRWKRAVRRVRAQAVPVAIALCVVLGTAVWWFSRTATVGFTIPLPVEIWVDGTLRGTTGGPKPLVVELPPGDYAFAVRAAGGEYAPVQVERIHLRRGDSVWPSVPLERIPVGSLDDPTFLDAFAAYVIPDVARALRDTFKAWNGFQATRASPDQRPIALFPRGPVRLADLSTLELEVPADFTPTTDWVLVVQRDGKDLVPPRVWAPRRGEAVPESTLALPDDVRLALAVGDTVRWGVRPRSGTSTDVLAFPLASFTVVGTDPSETLKALDERFAAQPPRLRAMLRARLLLQSGLATAAAREILAASPAKGRSFHEAATLAQALATFGSALDGSAVYTAARDVVDADEHKALRGRRFAASAPVEPVPVAPGR